ncbi:LLM class flavin-dependent oxidoreductase [Salinirarus marinus]|uniref:LLM class flavin-dependent oxidoreductase n=1 Tax=Salinirarus marinus TaxID=3068310 RepID=UPI003C6BE547
MNPPTVGLKLPQEMVGSQVRPRNQSAGEWGVKAENLSYDSIWTTEVWGSDVFVDLADVAFRTEKIRPASAIANVYSRSPAVLAMAAASVDRFAGGRAILGVGASHANVVEDLHGLNYDRPIRRSHEAIELIKLLTDGGEETVEYDGKVFQVTGHRPIESDVPVFNAALGDANLRATGRVADGWIPHLVPLSSLADEFETVAAAARKSERDSDEIEVVPQVLSAVDEDVERARNQIRQFVADYIGRYEAYCNKISETFPDRAPRIADVWDPADPEDAVAMVSDEMVDDLGVAGDPETARERLRALIDDPLIDRPIVYVPPQADSDILDRTIEELAPVQL